MFTSLDVAAYIAQECERRGYTCSNTKVQKLLYAAYGIMLAWRGERLCDEYPRAWPYGPVFPKVYNHIRKGGDVKAFSRRLADDASEDAENRRQVVHLVLDAVGGRTAGALSKWSHAVASPWFRVVEEEKAPWDSFIPDEYIRQYFLGMREAGAHA